MPNLIILRACGDANFGFVVVHGCDFVYVDCQIDVRDTLSFAKSQRKLGMLDEDVVRRRSCPAEVLTYSTSDQTPCQALNNDFKRSSITANMEPPQPQNENTEPPVSKKRKHAGDGGAKKKQKQNTAVYVTGLPIDATETEVHEVFSSKGGVIAEEIDSGKPRIKMYMDDKGEFKGDALVVYFKPQSVEMAIMLLDDTDFRVTANGTREGRISVQAADSSYKKVQYDKEGAPEGAEGGAQPSTREAPPPKKNDKDRQKIISRTKKLDAKLADWDDDDPYAAQAGPPTRMDKTVVLKHMFTLEELSEDPATLLDIKEDVRDECAKLGAVTNVVLYDLEPEGIISVKFRDAEAATACIQLMDGRSFAGQAVEATLATTKKLKFKKSQEDRGSESE